MGKYLKRSFFCLSIATTVLLIGYQSIPEMNTMLLRILYLLSFPSGILIHGLISLLGFSLIGNTTLVIIFGALATIAGYVQWFILTPVLFRKFTKASSTAEDQIVE